MVPFRVRLKEIILYRIFPRALCLWEVLEEKASSVTIPTSLPASTSPGKTALILYHGRGGGADQQAMTDAEKLAKDGYRISLLTFQVAKRRFVLHPRGLQGPKEYFYVPFSLQALWKRLDDLSLGEARIHHLRYWPDYVVRRLPDYFTSRHVKVALNLHDFYYICPRLHLLKGDYEFCGVPPQASICDACVKKSGQFINMPQDVSAWRAQNLRLLHTSQLVLAACQDTATHYHKIFPDLPIAMPPADIVPIPTLPRERATSTPLTIAIVGNLSRIKGADSVLAAATYIKTHSLPLRLCVIGDSVYAPELAAQGVSATGKYQHADLPRLLAEHKASYVWIASVCPETYCLVLDEVWKIGYPTIAFDIGAPAERIRLRNDPADVILPEAFARDAPALSRALARLAVSEKEA